LSLNEKNDAGSRQVQIVGKIDHGGEKKRKNAKKEGSPKVEQIKTAGMLF